MAFNDEVVKSGKGRAIRVDISLDGFSTVAHRYGDVAGPLDGTNMYSARVLSLGTIRRGLGQQRLMTSGTTSIRLANADGGVDWICGRESIVSATRARFRVYVVLYDVSAAKAGLNPNFTSKLLGEFTLTKQWPVQTDDAVELALSDDAMGPLAQQAALPTLADWAASGSAVNSPLQRGMGLPSSLSSVSAVQLAFGEDWVLAMPHIIPYENNNYTHKVVVPVCCTTNLDEVTGTEISSLRVEAYYRDDKVEFLNIPRNVSNTVTGSVVRNNWFIEKSPTIYKGGREFRIIYLVVDLLAGPDMYSLIGPQVLPSGEDATTEAARDAYENPHMWEGGYPLGAMNWAGRDYKQNLCKAITWWVQGPELSSRTGAEPVKHTVDVVIDLATHYSSAPNIAVNTTAAANVKTGNRFAACAGVVQPWTTGPKKGDTSVAPPPSLRQTLSLLAQSADIDIFIDWAGQLSFSSDARLYDVTTQVAASPLFAEEQMSGMQRTVPGDGERFAPFSRVYLEGGKAYPPEGRGIPYQGPFDFGGGEFTIDVTERIVEATLAQGWRPFRQQVQAPLYWRQFDTAARDRISFRTDISALRLDLGDYFRVRWTRTPSLGGPYVETVFQLESISYAASDDSIEIEAIWRGDLLTEKQYLLDDETLLVRAFIHVESLIFSGGESVEYFDDLGDSQPGDILVLKDSSLAEDDFGRYGAWRIIDIGTYLQIEVNAEGNYPTAGTVAAWDWYIVRGATTYPTDGDDPTNYPLGGEMYGKITTTAGEYSDSSPGNRLISG